MKKKVKMRMNKRIKKKLMKRLGCRTYERFEIQKILLARGCQISPNSKNYIALTSNKGKILDAWYCKVDLFPNPFLSRAIFTWLDAIKDPFTLPPCKLSSYRLDNESIKKALEGSVESIKFK